MPLLLRFVGRHMKLQNPSSKMGTPAKAIAELLERFPSAVVFVETPEKIFTCPEDDFAK